MGFVKYTNGNYDVFFSPKTGTKMRDNHRSDRVFDPDFPECIDVSVTNRCDIGCPFCYMDSKERGADASLQDVKSIFEGAHPFTEVAVGGGSPILHPDIREILAYFRRKNLVASMTIHWKHFLKMFNEVEEFMSGEDPLIKGLGISCTEYNDLLCKLIKGSDWGDRCVIHCIAGVINSGELWKWLKNGVNVIVLGYKNTGRGPSVTPNLDTFKYLLEMRLRRMLAHEETVSGRISFDNLALDQLDIRNVIGNDLFQQLYMGDDGLHGGVDSASMFIDAVGKKFAVNSMTSEQHKINEMSIDEMFKTLKRASYEH